MAKKSNEFKKDSSEASVKTISELVTEFLARVQKSEAYESIETRFTVDSPPGKVNNRVFIGGNYILMPILREISEVVEKSGFVPIIACDFEMPKEKTREYTLRLLGQCQFQIIEITLPGGEMVEIERAKAFVSSPKDMLLLYMSGDESRSPPSTVSIMTSQDEPSPQGYLTINELRELVQTFILTKKVPKKLRE